MKKNLVKGVLLSVLCSLIFLLGSFSDKQVVKDETLTIVATLTAKPEFKEDVLKAVKTVVDATRKEPGNISYNVFEDVKNPLKFVFIEKWKSQAAIDSHNKSAHFNDFIKAVKGKTDLEATVLKRKF